MINVENFFVCLNRWKCWKMHETLGKLKVLANALNKFYIIIIWTKVSTFMSTKYFIRLSPFQPFQFLYFFRLFVSCLLNFLYFSGNNLWMQQTNKIKISFHPFIHFYYALIILSGSRHTRNGKDKQTNYKFLLINE